VGGKTGLLTGGSKLRQALVVIALGTFAAGLLSAVLAVAGVLEPLPDVLLFDVVRLSPVMIVFLLTFVVTVAVAVAYILVSERIREAAPAVLEAWAKLPNPVKAVGVAVPVGVAAALALGPLDLFAFEDPIPVAYSLVAFGLGFLVTALLTFRHLVAKDELSRWNKTIVTGWVLTGSAAGALVVVDLLVAEVAIHGIVPLVVFYLGWPVVSFLILRQIRTKEEGFFSVLLVKSGFAQMRQLQTVTVAVAVGFLFALLLGSATQILVGSLQIATVAFFVVWLVGTVVAGWWFDRSITRTDLVIKEVRERSSNQSRELTVTNTGEDTVDMREAKIRDTEYDLYRTSMNIVLGAGQTGQFTIPPEFSLYPSEHDLGIDLPFGFTVSQGADAPVLVTREGVEYELQFEPREDGDGEPSDAGTGPGETTSKNA